MAEYAALKHAVWKEIAPELSAKEFNHPSKMDVGFLRLLSRTRRRAGVPFRLVADYWPGGPTPSHRELPCRAVCLRVKDAAERASIVNAALVEGFNRISMQPARPEKPGIVHLDD